VGSRSSFQRVVFSLMCGTPERGYLMEYQYMFGSSLRGRLSSIVSGTCGRRHSGAVCSGSAVALGWCWSCVQGQGRVWRCGGKRVTLEVTTAVQWVFGIPPPDAPVGAPKLGQARTTRWWPHVTALLVISCTAATPWQQQQQ
jgi:hypothetical protein